MSVAMVFKEWHTKERFKGPTFQSSSRVLFLSPSPAWRVPLFYPRLRLSRFLFPAS